MHIRSNIIVTAICLGSATFASGADFEDSARVISVTPQTEQVNHPRQECRTEYVQVEERNRSAGGSIIGGVAGAIIGNQVGKGNGRTAATAAGAIAGAVVGDRLENDDRRVVSERPVQQCHNVDHWETHNNGYAVTYEYHGHRYTSVLPYDPGNRLKVQVSVIPRI